MIVYGRKYNKKRNIVYKVNWSELIKKYGFNKCKVKSGISEHTLEKAKIEPSFLSVQQYIRLCDTLGIDYRETIDFEKSDLNGEYYN